MAPLLSRKFRKIKERQEIGELLSNRARAGETIGWQTLSNGRFIYHLRSVEIGVNTETIRLRGNFSVQKIDESKFFFMQFSSRLTILKAQVKEVMEGEILLHRPLVVMDEELRELSRLSLKAYEVFNSATIVLPNIFVKYSNLALRVKIIDINLKGLGLVLSKGQCQYITPGEKILIERLGVTKVNIELHGEAVYVQKIESKLFQDPDLVYKVGVKLHRDIPRSSLDFFMNYVEVNENEYRRNLDLKKERP